MSSDTEDHTEVSKRHLSSTSIHQVRSRRFDTTKSVKSFKHYKEAEEEGNTAVPRRMGVRSNSSSRLVEDPLVGKAMQKLLRKSTGKKRGNMENLEGECYISFQKLLSNELRDLDRKDYNRLEKAMRKPSLAPEPKVAKNSSTGLKKNKSDNIQGENDKLFKETLWLFGKKVGYTKGVFRVKLRQSIHQMGVGNMTENGIKLATSLILDKIKPFKNKEFKNINKGKEIGDVPEKFKDLLKFKNELFELEKTQATRSLKALQEREKLLKLIIETLSKNVSSKNNTVYENEFSLLRTQDLFLVLLLH